MSKMFSAELEKRAIRSLCSSKEAQKIWGQLTSAHFATEVGSLAFNRLTIQFRKKGEIPSWSSLLSDPGLPSTVKSSLKAFKTPPAKLPKTLASMRDNLEIYRKKRGLNSMIRAISERLEAEGGDVDDIMTFASKEFAEIGRVGSSLKINNIGRDDNTLELVEKILKGEVQRFIPTGFAAFDSANYGIPLGTMMLIAGSSGSGKSATADTLCKNFALQGAKVCLAPLEMNTESMLQRRLADQTGISLTKFLNPSQAMTRAEKLQAVKAYKKLSFRIRKAGGKLTYLSQDVESTLESILGFAKAHNYDVVTIDLVGLLAGVDGDDQAKALARVAKQCKLWATHNNGIVILVAQLTDDGLVKYSRALKENASTMWMFQRSAQDKENNLVTIKQEKSRQQSDMPFTLHMNLSTMTIRDLTAAEQKVASSLKTQSSGFKGKKKGGSKLFADL